jgi:hypothetical protein
METGDFAGGLAVDGALFEIGAFVARFFAGADSELGFHFAVFPVKLEDDEGAAFDLSFAVKFVDFLSM